MLKAESISCSGPKLSDAQSRSFEAIKHNLRTTHPKIARERNKERNGDLKPTDVIASSNKRVWWKCKEGHEWSDFIVNRAPKGKADPGCPYCSGRKVLAGYNDLAASIPS